MSADWYEVWGDDGLPVPYLLLVLPDEADKRCVVIVDPKENKVVHKAAEYETAKLWLLEDEYRRVEGRMTAE